MKRRILLFLNDILAIRSEPIDEDTRRYRIENWQRIYGTSVRIEIE